MKTHSIEVTPEELDILEDLVMQEIARKTFHELDTMDLEYLQDKLSDYSSEKKSA